jgi:exonuclease SbcC
MRINRLLLRNLNSLRGEFALDFDQPPLADAGIFAITGPTGAGKTTILDAIAVALYGQTPRLTAGSSAELLSRNSGECFAEVEFTVAQGRFRSRWSRRRARGKADGALQPTAMELVEITAAGERIIEDQVRAVIERVESLTGLDFARFTRSVMLAQGSFASFLKAKENERAELLERMTGTRIYSLISMEVFTRAREERARLDELTAINDHLDLLPPAELAGLEQEAAALGAAILLDDEALRGLRAKEGVALRFAALEAARRGVEEELAGVEAAAEAAAPEFARLALAEAARPCAPDLRQLDAVTGQHQALQAEALGLTQQGIRLQAELEGAVQARAVWEQEEVAFSAVALAREGVIQEAERLDQQLRVQQEELASRRQTITAMEQEQARLATAGDEQRQRFEQAAARIAALDLQLAESAQDAALGHDLSLLVEGLQGLAGHRLRFSDTRRRQERLEQELTRLGLESAHLHQQRQVAEQTLGQMRGQLAQGEAEVSAALQGQSCEGLEQAVAARQQRQCALAALVALGEELSTLSHEQTRQEARQQALTQELTACRLEGRQLDEQQRHGEELLVVMEERQALAAQVATLEQERGRLTPGAPCPLCGAVDHPWSAGVRVGVPEPDQARAAVVAQRMKLQAVVADLGGIHNRIGDREREATAVAYEISATAASVTRMQAELGQRFTEFAITSLEQAQQAKEAVEQAIIADQARLAGIRQRQNANAALLRQLMAAEKEGTAVVVELEKAQALMVNHQTAQVRCQEEAATLCQMGGELAAALTPQLALFGVTLPLPGQEEGVSAQLRQRWQRYDQARQERAALATSDAQARQAWAVISSQREGVAERLAREVEAAAVMAKASAALARSRFELLGSEEIVSAREGLAAERARLQARLSEQDQLVTSVGSQLATQQGLLAHNRTQLARLAEAGQVLTNSLGDQARAVGLADVEALRRALLADDAVQALAEQREAITSRRQRLADRLTEVRGELAGLGPEAAAIDGQAVTESIRQATDSLANRQQELGALRERIRRQQELALEYQQRVQAISAQRRELRQRQLLSDLIGAADGKKFRRFAQGLTLDHLIALANRQLTRLSDRYLLRRHQGEELGLEIMDTYQADAIRPTGTLSGGEEFLVSLALALGLANLSGQTRIDSLFLDEGFGTLDTDTLETALAALAALQESGKTIGIISHVDALKERIPVRIRLRKLAGGLSTMTVT